LPLALLPLALSHNVGPYLVGLFAGFGIGCSGHLVKSTPLILVGIAVIFVSAVLLLIGTDPSS
jgi:hypothetical protein